jgi:hypothetical protein
METLNLLVQRRVFIIFSHQRNNIGAADRLLDTGSATSLLSPFCDSPMPAAQSQLRDSLNLTHDFQFCSLHFGLSSHSPPGSVAPALRPCGLASFRPCSLAGNGPSSLPCGGSVRPPRSGSAPPVASTLDPSLPVLVWKADSSPPPVPSISGSAQLRAACPTPDASPLARCPGCRVGDSVGGWSCGCCGAGADHGPHIRAVVLDPCTSALRAAAARKHTPRAWTEAILRARRPSSGPASPPAMSTVSCNAAAAWRASEAVGPR